MTKTLLLFLSFLFFNFQTFANESQYIQSVKHKQEFDKLTQQITELENKETALTQSIFTKCCMENDLFFGDDKNDIDNYFTNKKSSISDELFEDFIEYCEQQNSACFTDYNTELSNITTTIQQKKAQQTKEKEQIIYPDYPISTAIIPPKTTTYNYNREQAKIILEGFPISEKINIKNELPFYSNKKIDGLDYICRNNRCIAISEKQIQQTKNKDTKLIIEFISEDTSTTTNYSCHYLYQERLWGCGFIPTTYASSKKCQFQHPDIVFQLKNKGAVFSSSCNKNENGDISTSFTMQSFDCQKNFVYNKIPCGRAATATLTKATPIQSHSYAGYATVNGQPTYLTLDNASPELSLFLTSQKQKILSQHPTAIPFFEAIGNYYTTNASFFSQNAKDLILDEYDKYNIIDATVSYSAKNNIITAVYDFTLTNQTIYEYDLPPLAKSPQKPFPWWIIILASTLLIIITITTYRRYKKKQNII